jgi:hypothetical protein
MNPRGEKMTTSAVSQREDFLNLLAASARSPEIPESHDVYGWLVGSWDLEVVRYAAVDVAPLHINGEAHFGWVLEGRAIQDVWIMPRPSERSQGLEKTNNMYGSTLRVWDVLIQAWRIRWINPVTGHCEDQIGRRVGRDIVQIGTRADGTPTRWRFTEITPDSFHWIGDSLSTDGTTWILEGEFRVTRKRT